MVASLEACFIAWATWPAISLAPFGTPDAPLSGRGGGSPPGWSAARTEGKGPPHIQLDRAAVQPAEDAREDAGGALCVSLYPSLPLGHLRSPRQNFPKIVAQVRTRTCGRGASLSGWPAGLASLAALRSAAPLRSAARLEDCAGGKRVVVSASQNLPEPHPPRGSACGRYATGMGWERERLVVIRHSAR
jgi:hypothetical protein